MNKLGSGERDEAETIMGYMGFLQFVISQGATKQAMFFTVFQQINLSTGQERACLFMVIIRKLVLHIPLLLILPWSFPRRSRTFCQLLQRSFSLHRASIIRWTVYNQWDDRALFTTVPVSAKSATTLGGTIEWSKK